MTENQGPLIERITPKVWEPKAWLNISEGTRVAFPAFYGNYLNAGKQITDTGVFSSCKWRSSCRHTSHSLLQSRSI